MSDMGGDGSGFTRRQFVRTTSLTIAAGATIGSSIGELAAALAENRGAETPLPVKLRINGKDHALKLEPRVTLLDALRERLGLTGSKKGCDHGQCGACTVLVNGRRINSCLSLAVVHDGDEITTIEGLAKGDELHPMQVAFVKHDGFQCGYCTPGQICSAVALVGKEGCPASSAGIREMMSGNLCRCGAYNGIVAAIQEVRGQSA